MSPIKVETVESYQKFLEFVEREVSAQRYNVNRKMFGVLIWCFVFPLFAMALLLIGIWTGYLPASARNLVDWIVVVFPLIYAAFYFGDEIFRDLRGIVKKGGMSNVLRTAARDGKWRQEVSSKMIQELGSEPHFWKWVIRHYKIDLERIQSRNRYLTVLGTAVLYLVLHILSDFEPLQASDLDEPRLFIVDLVQAIREEFTLMVGLILFATLFYLTGIQHQQVLSRYLDAAQFASERDD